MTRELLICGTAYTEAKPGAVTDPMGGVCRQCAFGGVAKVNRCIEAINRSADVFGGDCMERDVIYVRKGAES